jgi:hypothetical protein
LQFLNTSYSQYLQKCLGGSDIDIAHAIKSTLDGGYIIAGSTESNDGYVSNNYTNKDGYMDCWIVKIDGSGSIEWEKCLGGSEREIAYDIQLTPDGGYIFAGTSSSINGDVSKNYGNYDCWVVKLDDSGNIEWKNNYGSQNGDYHTLLSQQLTEVT